MIRSYMPGEEMSLYHVFYSSIHENAQNYYTQEQLEAWAPRSVDPEKWSRKIKGMNPFVLDENGTILGYGDLQDSGLIDHFFIRGGHGGKGLGGLLMNHILNAAHEKKIKKLYSHVSLAAQPFFKKHGFLFEEHNKVVIRGITLENALMHRKMDSSDKG